MLSETPYPAFPGSNKTNLYLHFDELLLSLVIHDSRAEVLRFMIPKFLKQRFKILTCFVPPKEHFKKNSGFNE